MRLIIWTLTAAIAAAASPLLAADAPKGQYNNPGNILISDQFNNRVIEINDRGDIIWNFGLGPNDISARSPVGVNDALRVGDRTLISGTGAPPGTEPLCPSGCPDNRVFFVDKAGHITWQYGTFGVTGSGPNQLNTPVQATWTASHTVLITDQGNQRVIEVSLKGAILWQYGQTGVSGAGPDQLNNPNSVEVLDNGDYLIADENNNRAIVVNRAKTILQTFTAGGALSGVAFASRLPNGLTLITDSNNNRIVEVDGKDKIVWSYRTNTQLGSNPNPLPTRAVRLKSGATLISDQFNHRVILVSHAGKLLRQWGTLNSPGYGTASTTMGMNAPYDAKAIGDHTGLTWFNGAVTRGR
ncbi:MAG: hypothetical protein JWO83_3017 [Caulobacteraceae bacterium]|nr:hypothetical protein [Caulobacteraceae bacterium]